MKMPNFTFYGGLVIFGSLKWANLMGDFNGFLYFSSFNNIAHITLLDKKMSLFHFFVLQEIAILFAETMLMSL